MHSLKYQTKFLFLFLFFTSIQVAAVQKINKSTKSKVILVEVYEISFKWVVVGYVIICLKM